MIQPRHFAHRQCCVAPLESPEVYISAQVEQRLHWDSMAYIAHLWSAPVLVSPSDEKARRRTSGTHRTGPHA